MKRQNFTNQRFGRLVVIKQASKNPVKWLCRCDCGKETSVFADNLRRGHTQSCGCLNQELRLERITTHGMSGTRVYRIWFDMKRRGKDPNRQDYRYYHGRGIKVSSRWEKFENFFQDMGLPPTDKHTLDRIDNDGDYSPENCRWATRKEQARNTRNNRNITYNGETHCLAEWCEILHLKPHTFHNRIKQGWLEEEALFTPTLRRHSYPISNEPASSEVSNCIS